jgi:hypothetical protein
MIKNLNDQKKESNELRSALISNKNWGTTTASTTRDSRGRGEDRKNGSSTKPLINSTCAKAAVDVRKPALSTAQDVFFASTKTALLAREDGIRASFDQLTERDRVLARVNARNTYKKSVKDAMEILRKSQKTIMDTYSNSIKACGRAV